MALEPKDVARLKTFLGKEIDGGTPSEISAFKASLAKVSLETIRERLDTETISRSWKRKLAEAEFGRREDIEANDLGEANLSAEEIRRLRDKRFKKWSQWVSAALIAGCTVILLYTAFIAWSM